MSDLWTKEKMYELGTRHARLEEEMDLDGLMKTLVDDPVYEFYPLELTMSGGDNVRRYYKQFMANFMRKIVGYKLLDEWVSEASVVQEYDITTDSDGLVETHRTVGILFAEGELLGGERIYGSHRLVELMTGEMFGELQAISKT